MADITVTAANVLAVAGSKTEVVTLGGTITQGMPLYRATDGMYEACDASAIATNKCEGIALTAGSDGQPGIIIKSGNVDLGATLALGSVYVCSATAGKICPEEDIASTEFVCVLGVADAADNLKMNILYTEVAHV